MQYNRKKAIWTFKNRKTRENCMECTIQRTQHTLNWFFSGDLNPNGQTFSTIDQPFFKKDTAKPIEFRIRALHLHFTIDSADLDVFRTTNKPSVKLENKRNKRWKEGNKKSSRMIKDVKKNFAQQFKATFIFGFFFFSFF